MDTPRNSQVDDRFPPLNAEVALVEQVAQQGLILVDVDIAREQDDDKVLDTAWDYQYFSVN